MAGAVGDTSGGFVGVVKLLWFGPELESELGMEGLLHSFEVGFLMEFGMCLIDCRHSGCPLKKNPKIVLQGILQKAGQDPDLTPQQEGAGEHTSYLQGICYSGIFCRLGLGVCWGNFHLRRIFHNV